ncbi:MAG: helix-turn-helix transcriptional regulator [Slackia faecicanis]|nr:helix-turn-helix transcriptional regulator [Slackia faecicanis]
MAPVASALSDAVFVDMQFVDQVFMTHSENIVAAAVVGISWLALKRKPDTVRAFTVLFPLLATVFLVFLFVPALRGLVPYIGGVAFVVCSMTVLVESASSASARGLDAGLMYGVCAGVLYASNALGSLAMNLAGETVFDETSMMLVVVVLLYGCSIVMFFITRKGSGVGEAPDGASCESVVSDKASMLSDELDFSQLGPSVVHDDAIGAAARKIGQSSGLTERQIEVFILLAHGYTIPAAASAMYLSENTVRTHAKKIYAALGIHSKQELIELVAEAAAGA